MIYSRWSSGLVLLATIVSLSLFVDCYAMQPATRKVLLADYDSAPRINGHVDSDVLIKRLKFLGANTYFWLIWSHENDWKDLQDFLPKAWAKNIDVWVYLVPPSETPEYERGRPFPLPYKTDYWMWAKKIGLLSRRWPNLRGYVIDDFFLNVPPRSLSNDCGYRLKNGLFSRGYITKMIRAGKAENPRLLFYPLIYANRMTCQEFLKEWVPTLDGAIIAYPSDFDKSLKDAASIRKIVDLPMYLMTPIDEETNKKFLFRQGTVADVRDQLDIISRLIENGAYGGVVTYGLGKRVSDLAVMQVVQRTFFELAKSVK